MFLYSVVDASFEEVTYFVNEEDGFLEGCIGLNGQIQRELVITLSTSNGSATGNILSIKDLFSKLITNILLQLQRTMKL